LGHWFEAVQEAAKAVHLRKTWPYAHLTYGRALFQFGEVVRAAESFQRAVDLAPDDTEIYEELLEAQSFIKNAGQRAANSGLGVVVNGRFLENSSTGFWEGALKVTYDEHGRPTTHFPEDYAGGTT